MAPNGTTLGSRKRGRPRKDDPEEEDEEEEHSPSTLSSTKKRRLNDEASIPSSTSAPGVLQTIGRFSRAISGGFGYGRRTVSSSGAVKKGSAPIDSSWEVPDSEEERQKTRDDKKTNKAPSVADRTPKKAAKSVYDVPDTDSDEAPSSVTLSSSKTRVRPPTKVVESGGPGKAITRASAVNGTSSGKKPSIKGASQGSTYEGSLRTYSRKPRASVIQEEDKKEESSEEDSSEDEDEEEPVPTPTAARSSARRGRPAATEAGSDTPIKLKGILTPRKNGNTPSRKSVAFENGENETAEVHFEDAPKSAKPIKSTPEPPKKSAKGTTPKKIETLVEESEESEEDEDEDDDEVCVICSKPDSKAPNRILFCDGCDMAVHQKCYDVPKVPHGDWFCRDCSKEPSGTPQKMAVNGTKAGVVKAPVEVVPDIPNFEQHLRSLQRVLIDRCTCRRRIPIRDQEEAYDRTFQLVEQTVLAGEGNSMLIIGARGSGKTTVGFPT